LLRRGAGGEVLYFIKSAFLTWVVGDIVIAFLGEVADISVEILED
jgi:hypothetical protein